MAELIPIEYRLRVEQKKRIGQWAVAGVVAVLLSIGGLVYAVVEERQHSAQHATVLAEYNAKSAVLTKSRELRDARGHLASRMQKIQELMDDKVLLQLLRNISAGFSGSDSLEFIEIDARGVSLPTEKQTGDNVFAVRISGITENSTTLAKLMTRLTSQQSPEMSVVLQNSTREKYLDGQVMRFQIVCERAEKKGS